MIDELQVLFGVKLLQQELKLADLRYDHDNYQRYPVQRRLDELCNNPKKLEMPHVGIVARRADNSLWVVNGQHHSLARIMLLQSTGTYYVFNSKDIEEEKTLYDAYQAYQADGTIARLLASQPIYNYSYSFNPGDNY